MSGLDMKSLHRVNRELSGTGIKAEMAFFSRKKQSHRGRAQPRAVQACPSYCRLAKRNKACQVAKAAIRLSKHVQASGGRLGRNRRGGGRPAAGAGLLAHPRVPQQLRPRRQTAPGARLVCQDSIPRGAPDDLARRGGSGCRGGEGGRPVRPASASRLAGTWLT